MNELVNLYHQNQGLINGVITILGVTGVMGALKKVIAKDLSNHTLAVILTGLSTAGSFLQWLGSNFSQSGATFGTHTFAIVGATHVLYNLIVKPGTNLAKDVQATKQSQAASSQPVSASADSAASQQNINPKVVNA